MAEVMIQFQHRHNDDDDDDDNDVDDDDDDDDDDDNDEDDDDDDVDIDAGTVSRLSLSLVAGSYLPLIRAKEDVSEEISEIEENREQQSHGLSLMEVMRNLARHDVRTPFLLVAANYLIVNLSGLYAVIFSATEVYEAAGAEGWASILVSFTLFLSSILGLFLVDRVARVRLLMVSMTMMSACTAVLGTSLYLTSLLGPSPLLDLVPVLSVTVYILCYGSGAGPLTIVYHGELIPRDYNVLAGVVMFLANLSVLTVTKSLPTLLDTLSPHGTYWLFSIIGLSSNIFYLLFMPDTRGRTEGEIKRLLD